MTGSHRGGGRDVSRETSRPGAEHDRIVKAIVDRARKAGALAHHCNDPRYCDGPGLPDVLLLGIAGPAFIEVKTGSGTPRPDQNDWLCTSRACGVWAMVCGPADLDNGNVDELITAVTTWPPAAPELDQIPIRPPTPGSG